jgi:hypothetical protein
MYCIVRNTVSATSYPDLRHITTFSVLGIVIVYRRCIA